MKTYGVRVKCQSGFESIPALDPDPTYFSAYNRAKSIEESL